MKALVEFWHFWITAAYRGLNYFQSVAETIASFKVSKAATGGVLLKMVFLKISQYSLENICVGISFYYSCEPSVLQLYLKRIQTQVISCEYCKIFKNNYFEEYPWTNASKTFLVFFTKWIFLLNYQKLMYTK